MLKITSFTKKQKKSHFLLIMVFTSILLVASPVAALVSNFESPEKNTIEASQSQVPIKTSEHVKSFTSTNISYENKEILPKTGHYKGIICIIMIEIMILFYFIHPYNTKLREKLKTNFISFQNIVISSLTTIWVDELDQQKAETRKLRFFTVIPVLFISFAEILIFWGKTEEAMWVDICTLIMFSISNIFIKNSKIHKIYIALMFLPILRIINNSMPVFFETTLYNFILFYGPLIIPVIAITMHKKDSIEEIGITTKNFFLYAIISLPLGFLIGLGEYFMIKTGPLIPDISFVNLLQLTIIMVFIVGLIEELIFRAILQKRLEKYLGIKEALLITSILFGLMHSEYGIFQEIVYTSFVGLIIGFAFYKTRNLPFVAIIHGIANVFLFGIIPHII